MKRILFFVAISGLLFATSGCSNGLLSGGLTSGLSGGACNNCSGGLFGGGSLLPTNFLQDGPVRKWFRGDACDSCNVPAGQITYDSGFDSSCESGLCGDVSSPVISNPVSTGYGSSDFGSPAPATNYYPSYNESVPQYGESLPQLPLSGPMDGGSGIGNINESQFFGDANDSIELPPMSGY